MRNVMTVTVSEDLMALVEAKKVQLTRLGISNGKQSMSSIIAQAALVGLTNEVEKLRKLRPVQSLPTGIHDIDEHTDD